MSQTYTGIRIEGYPARASMRIILTALLLTAAPGAARVGRCAVHTLEVNPTVLFARDKDGLTQIVEIVVENTGPAAQANLEVRIGSASRSVPLGEIQQGKSTRQVPVPDVREATSAQFVLKTDGAGQDVKKVDWKPRKHWTIYFVPITHHDLGYTDTIEHVLNRYAGFYDDVLRFCDQTSDWPEEAKYRYTLEGTWSLKHFIENRPKETIDRFGAYVRQGRIDIGAFFGNEIDSLCGHEQQVRLMYPSFRFVREYGGKISVGSLTDLPGLSWGTAMVLSGAGIKYFFAGLPTYFEWGRNDIHTFWDEAAILRHGRPDAFRWQGPDGQSVLVYYQGSYGFFKRVVGPDTCEEVMEALPGMLDEMDEKGSPFDVMRYIHNGVDNYPPDVRISEVVRQWNEKWVYPKLVVATNTMFFEALEKQCDDVRTFRGELPHTDYVVGALSTAKETTINRLTHDKLLSAEKAATIASLVCDHAYPADKIAQAYDDVLLYDEHTWGKDYPAGELQDWAWNEKSHYAYRAAGLAQSVLTDGLDRIAGNVRLEEGGRQIVVFNPLAFDRTDVVRVTKCAVDKPFDLIDNETGRAVPCQVVELDGPLAPVPYAAYRWARGQFERHELFDLVFVAEHVPSMGYKTYRIVPREGAAKPKSELAAAPNSIENRFFKVTLDPQTGAIASVYDKDLSRELVDRQAPDKLNQFVAKWVQTGKREGPTCTEIRIGEEGPVYASLVSRGSGPGCPEIAQEVILYDGIKRIDLANRILKDSAPLLEIYFAFPFKVDDPRFRFEGSNSVIEPFKDQFPGSNTNYYAVQHWATVSNEDVQIVLSPVESHLLEFGGLWPCYCSQAHHGFTAPDFGQPFVRSEQVVNGHIYAFVMDSNFRTNFQPVQQSDILFRYSLASHGGQRANSVNRDLGWSAHNPLTGVVVDGPRTGKLESHASFCQLEPPNVLLVTVKRAEDGRGIIARLIESDGEPTATTLSVPGLTIEKAWQTDIVEENQIELNPTDHAVSVPIKAFGIATVRLEVRAE
ncbi:MAG: glycosyl hydrolase-related protein [Phycisphaerales bacterium]